MAKTFQRLLRRVIKTTVNGLVGAALVLLIVFVVMLNDRPDLSVWHLAELDEEFTADSDVSTFAQYLELEDRLFRQLDELVHAETVSERTSMINRYSRGSMSDPGRWPSNWNRSYEMPVDSPTATALLLHGMSDSPYSLRNIAEMLHQSGVYVVGLRIPGHGTAPSGLVSVRWQDMAAAVRIAMQHVSEQAPDRPVYLVGYSNGGALAVNYVLSTLAEPALPQVDRVVLLSAEIGVAKVAAFAVWQARLGDLLGLDKLAWNGILPEYDPYKYGSFAVNAGDVAYRLTVEIQRKLTELDKSNRLNHVPPILAFTSIVDATVSAPALVEGLFNRLPQGGHELVIFDINHAAQFEHIMRWNPEQMYSVLQSNLKKSYNLSLVSNKNSSDNKVTFTRKLSGTDEQTVTDLDLAWPVGFYSLSHVSLPFPADDPLYGNQEITKSPGINIGNAVLRGEKGALLIPAAEMLRVRWNPFYSVVETTVLEFLNLKDPESSGQP